MKKKKNRITLSLEIILVVLSFLLGSLLTILLVGYIPIFNNQNNNTKVYEKSSLGNSINKIADSVVLVKCYNSNQVSSTGSGFVYKTDSFYGYILTNEHVVTGFERIAIEMNNSEEEINAKVLGKDSYLDLAVLRIPKSKVKQIAKIGNSEKVYLGDTIFTVGSPIGSSYKGTVTSGILSGKDRMVSVNVNKTASNDWIMKVLQIDASINPGNSGGPLVNINGEVIGICSMKLVDNEIEGMGFAIPIEYAMNNIKSLENNQEIKWPVLGVGMYNVTDTANLVRSNIKISSDIKEGVVIIQVGENSSAAKANLQKGDIITKINNNKVIDIAHLRYELYQHSSDDVIKITIIRNGKYKNIRVKLG